MQLLLCPLLLRSDEFFITWELFRALFLAIKRANCIRGEVVTAQMFLVMKSQNCCDKCDKFTASARLLFAYSVDKTFCCKVRLIIQF